MTQIFFKCRLFIALLVLMTASFSAFSNSDPLLGRWVTQAGDTTLVFASNGLLSFNGQQFRYSKQGNTIVVQSSEGLESYQYQFRGQNNLIVTGRELGMLSFVRQSSGSSQASSIAQSPASKESKKSTTTALSSTDPTSGMLYKSSSPGRNEIVNKEHGFSIKLSEGFQGAYREDGFIIGHERIPGFLYIYPLAESITPQDLNRAAEIGYHESDVQLNPVQAGNSKPVNTGQGQGLYFDAQGYMGKEKVRGYLAGFIGPTEQGLVVLGATTPDKWSLLEPHARKMIESVRLFPADSKAVREWKDKLAGKKLLYWYYYSSSGLGGSHGSDESKRYWHLCPDGSYWYTDSHHMHIDTGTGEGSPGAAGGQYWGLASTGGRGKDQGTWKIIPQGQGSAMLVLNSANGGVNQYTLTMKRKQGSNYKYMGDMKIFTDGSAQCQ